jgi:MmyB-like transcription regulator ligand binding domain
MAIHLDPGIDLAAVSGPCSGPGHERHLDLRTELAELIRELSRKSEDFRTMWAVHDVKRKSHGSMRMMHPLAGELTLRYETFTLPGDALVKAAPLALSLVKAAGATDTEEITVARPPCCPSGAGSRSPGDRWFRVATTEAHPASSSSGSRRTCGVRLSCTWQQRWG